MENNTKSLISILLMVTITWAVGHTNYQASDKISVVNKMATASIYSKPGSVKKTILLEHILSPQDSRFINNNSQSNHYLFPIDDNSNVWQLYLHCFCLCYNVYRHIRIFIDVCKDI